MCDAADDKLTAACTLLQKANFATNCNETTAALEAARCANSLAAEAQFILASGLTKDTFGQ